jgi:hypothetical protein
MESVRSLIEDILEPAHFYVGNGLMLEWRYHLRREEAWEIVHGRLIDPAQTRLRKALEVWEIAIKDCSDALLSLKLDPETGSVFVTRAILCHAWEGYHAGDNVYLSRPTQKWLPELVGMIHLEEWRNSAELRDELISLIFQAVVGKSRLPLTSLENPLPAFSLGQLAYCYRSSARRSEPLHSPRELIQQGLNEDLNEREIVKTLEIVLRSSGENELPEAAAEWTQQRLVERRPDATPAKLRRLFEEVALSPYTDFVSKTLAWMRHWTAGGWLTIAEHIDVLSYLLRQLARHLTAYDLVTFHHRGANYPDLLLLDAVLKEYVSLAEGHPELFLPAAAPKLRRRALRQAWLLRRHYEGHAVPDMPTSPGENARVWPFPQVPDDQIADPTKRTKRMFEDDLLPHRPEGLLRELLEASLQDLQQPDELRELGMAVFLDRPLGTWKHPLEPDQTVLLAYEAWSRSIALARLQEIWQKLGFLVDSEELAVLKHMLETLKVDGLRPTTNVAFAPGKVSIADTAKAAQDFLLLRTTAQSHQAFQSCFDWTQLGDRFSLDFMLRGKRILIMRHEIPGSLAIYDSHFRQRLALRFSPKAAYRCRAGLEYPAKGLEATHGWHIDDYGRIKEYRWDPSVPLPTLR